MVHKCVWRLCLTTAVLLLAGCGRTAGSGDVETGKETAAGEIPTIWIEPVPTETENIPETEPETLPESGEADWEMTAVIATDIHYLAGDLTDGGSYFEHLVEHGDGKVVTYIEPITDAFLEEVKRQKPDVLILSGDLTLEGEKESHQELAGKLQAVEAAGIPVLVIPGNHDINNRRAARFVAEERMPAEFTTPEEFLVIYEEFGYREAISRDKTSLSYVYQLDEDNRFLMLDTCQYRPYAKVGGAILADTYDWIEEQLEAAWDDGMNIIPVGHHNLLDQSEIYVDDCTIEHGEQLADMLNDWSVPLFLSGHLHVQHAKRSEDGYGIWEVVTSSLATPACQYGVLEFRADGSFGYRTWAVDVEHWAVENNRDQADLLEFNSFKEPFLRRVFYNQSYDKLSELESLTEQQKQQMSEFYSDLNYHYYQGTAYSIRDTARQDPAFKLWEDEGSVIQLGDYVLYIIEDAKWNYNYLETD